jgi:hypothetical protein
MNLNRYLDQILTRYLSCFSKHDPMTKQLCFPLGLPLLGAGLLAGLVFDWTNFYPLGTLACHRCKKKPWFLMISSGILLPNIYLGNFNPIGCYGLNGMTAGFWTTAHINPGVMETGLSSLVLIGFCRWIKGQHLSQPMVNDRTSIWKEQPDPTVLSQMGVVVDA